MFLGFKCVEEGSVYGNQYDPETGTCTCKAGRTGSKCQGKNSNLCYKMSHLSQEIHFPIGK